MTFDHRDRADAHRLAADLRDIGVISRDDRIRINRETAELAPQAVTQALVSFLVNQRIDQIPPENRAGYIISSARTQHMRVMGYGGEE